MIERRFNKCLLEPADFQPSQDEFEVVGAFNPGAIATGNGDEVVLLVRIAERPRDRRTGHYPLVRWDTDAGEIITDWLPDTEWDAPEPRIISRRADGIWRLTFTSHLRVVRSENGRDITTIDGPRLLPAHPLEEYGVEDPRITQIGNTFYVTYVGISSHGPTTMLASTTDFEHFERHGAIFCPENKDVVLFPERFGGQYLALHRPAPHAPFNFPEMWIARSPDLLHWGAHAHFLGGAGKWDAARTGAGTPPIRTERGWLEIYHGKTQDPAHGVVGAYAAGALLLDLDDPGKILARSPEPVLVPQTEYETTGFVPNVVFPTGLVQRDDRLMIYYGAADTATAVVEVSLRELLDTCC